MYQSGRAGDETKKRKSPAKSGRVGITDIDVIVKALIRVFLYHRHVVTFWQGMQFVQGHVTLLLVKQPFLEELVAMNFQRSLST